MGMGGSEERPVYGMVLQESDHATKMWMITVDEGWRSWILCTNMYAHHADQLLGILVNSGHRWRDSGG